MTFQAPSVLITASQTGCSTASRLRSCGDLSYTFTGTCTMGQLTLSTGSAPKLPSWTGGFAAGALAFSGSGSIGSCGPYAAPVPCCATSSCKIADQFSLKKTAAAAADEETTMATTMLVV